MEYPSQSKVHWFTSVGYMGEHQIPFTTGINIHVKDFFHIITCAHTANTQVNMIYECRHILVYTYIYSLLLHTDTHTHI